MPQRVLFRVIQCTGSDDEYPAKDLEVQSPFIKGWRSPRFCLYPQELVLRLDPPARVRRVQLLSHQHLISSRVELFIGAFTSSKYASMDSTKFSRLGYITLSDNDATGYRSRELKSIDLDCYGELIKFVLQKNHVNQLNSYNQVGLVALNILADSHVVADTGIPGNNLSGQTLLGHLVHGLPGINQLGSDDPDLILQGRINKPSSISPMDDGAVAKAQDPETADLIQELENRKATAIKDENFGAAKRLKLVIEELSKAGQLLWCYELQKREAIVREDYDTARAKKDKLDSARMSIYEQLEVHGLLSRKMSKRFASRHTQHRSPPPRESQVLGPSLFQQIRHHVAPLDRHNTAPFLSMPGAIPTATGRMGEDVMKFGWEHTSPLPPIAVSFPPPSPPLPKTSTSPEMKKSSDDERPLPSLLKRSEGLVTVLEQEELPSDQLQGEWSREEDVAGQVDTAVVEPLTEKQLADVQTAVDVFGMDVVESLFAKQFSVRERSLLAVHSMLSSKSCEAEGEKAGERMTRRDVATTVRAACQVLANGFKDKVFSTFSCCQDLLRHLVGPFTKQHNVSKQELSPLVDKVVPVLLTRTGGLPPRICAAAVCSVTELLRHVQIQELIGPVLVGPYKQHRNPSWRLIKGRLVLLARLTEDPGLASCGLNIRRSMTFVANYLDHNAGEVREAAADLTIKLYEMNGVEVRALMPVPDNAISRRKTLWKKLFEKFDKIDGGPSPAKIEVPWKTSAHGESAKGSVTVRKKPLTQTTTANSHPEAGKASKHSHKLGSAEGQWVQGEEASNGSSSCISNEGGGGDKEERTLEESRGREETEALDKMCVFCGKEQEDLLSEVAMECHYLEECPMLQACSQCDQVVEIAALTNHWLTECKYKDQFQACLICKEAVLKEQLSKHAEDGGCIVRRKEQDEKPPWESTMDHTDRCPLCHSFIPLGDEGWRVHLMGHRGSPNTCSEKRIPANKMSSIQHDQASSTLLVQKTTTQVEQVY